MEFWRSITFGSQNGWLKAVQPNEPNNVVTNN